MKHLKYKCIKMFLIKKNVRIHNTFWMVVNRETSFWVQMVQVQHLLTNHVNQSKLEYLGLTADISQRIFVRVWSSIFTEDGNTVNKTIGKERFHLLRNATGFDQIYRQLFKLLSAAWDRTTGAWVWAWLDPAVIKSGFGPRQPTAETQFNIAALSFRQHLICHMLCSSLSSSTYSTHHTRPHPNAVFA